MCWLMEVCSTTWGIRMVQVPADQKTCHNSVKSLKKQICKLLSAGCFDADEWNVNVILMFCTTCWITRRWWGCSVFHYLCLQPAWYAGTYHIHSELQFQSIHVLCLSVKASFKNKEEIVPYLNSFKGLWTWVFQYVSFMACKELLPVTFTPPPFPISPTHCIRYPEPPWSLACQKIGCL